MLHGATTVFSEAIPNTPVETTYTFTVDFEEDIDDNLINGFCEDFAGRCTLRAAIQEANAQVGQDTILIEPGTYLLTQAGTGEDNADTGDLDITDDVIIQATGPGVYIDGNQIDRVFHIPNAGVTVQIEDVTIRNGQAPETINGGGGIYNWGALILKNVTVANNSAGNGVSQGGNGGGINTSGPLTLDNSYIVSNQSGEGTDGSAPSAGGKGGGVYATFSQITITNSIIAYNTTGQGGAGTSGSSGAGGGSGGGLYLGNNTIVTISDSAIHHNSTGSGGSGENNGGPAGNDAGLHFRGDALTMTDVAVYGNSTGSGAAGSNNDGSGGGCGGVGIWYARGVVTLSQSAIYGNTTGSGRYGGLGGGLCYMEPVSDYLTVDNSTISGNTASSGTTSGGNGGGFYTIVNPGTAVYLHNSTISDNEAAGSGGGIYYDFFGSGPLYVRNSILANNSAAGSGPDCSGPLVSQGYSLIEDDSACTITGDTTGNIIGQDPLLGALQANGGATPTQAILPGSPAIDSGHPTECPPVDQRGATRPNAFTGVNRCDMGAFELQGQESSTVPNLPEGTAVIFGGTLVSMTRQIGSADPLTTTVAKLDQPPGGGDPDSGEMAVTWTISATVDSGLDIDVSFCYSDGELGGLTEADLSAYRYDGAAWQEMGGVVNKAENCLLLEGVTAFSQWTLATETPTMPLPQSGEIQGTVTYTGANPAATIIEVGLHTALNDPPVVSQDIPVPGGVYSFTAVPNGSYYVSAFIDLDNSGGPPGPGDLLLFYDANGDDVPDAVTVNGNVLTGIDLTLTDEPAGSGEIQGTVTYTGSNPAATIIEVGLHTALNDPPVVSQDIPVPGGVYSFTAVPNGSYYVSAFIDLNNSGGPPDPDDLLLFYDANGDGEPDMVTVADDVVTNIDLALVEKAYLYLPMVIKP